jgi:8-oxo-dGTP pyrophosphatase MutT (NUDIX family)
VCLLRDGDKFLLQHRTDDALRDPGRWGFFGGHIDDEEVPPDAEKTPLAAIKREIKEELDYDLTDPELVFVYRNDEVEINVFTEQYDPAKKLTLLEGKDMRWFTFEQAQILDMVGVDRQMFVNQLREVWEKGDGI